MEYELIQGERMARLGFGTWRLSGTACYQAVRSALELGYRHIDTAEMYGNEAEVAWAIADAGVAREELFLTTKVWQNHLRHREVLRSCEASLRALRVEAVDLYLVHWPDPSVPIEETMGALHALVQSGKARRIGVSNFSVAELAAARVACPTPLFTNQVPCHVQRPQPELLGYCQEHDIMLTAYSPLAKGRLAGHPVLEAIGEKHAKSAAQVALRWLIQQPKVIAIPMSSDPHRQRENLEVFDFALSPTEMAEIGALAG
jgi:diketogulonate reductase-like aldo/keto reductase